VGLAHRKGGYHAVTTNSEMFRRRRSKLTDKFRPVSSSEVLLTTTGLAGDAQSNLQNRSRGHSGPTTDADPPGDA